jgi:hypothetical protein
VAWAERGERGVDVGTSVWRREKKERGGACTAVSMRATDRWGQAATGPSGNSGVRETLRESKVVQ